MAKDNLFLGMGRGSVGDVTFYRANGEQIARARNRRPRNPRTNQQQFQRAILATISQAYKAGKAIFDHAFEGESKGAGCQRRFLRENLKALRQAVAADLNSGVTTAADATARVVGPGSTIPVPNAYIISQGSYEQRLMTLAFRDNYYGAQLADSLDGETTKAYCLRNSLVVNDYYTICAFASTSNEAGWDSPLGQLASQPRCNFGFVRLRVKEEAFEDTAVLANWGQIFEAESSSQGSAFQLSDLLISDRVEPEQIVNNPDFFEGAIGVIRSRKDQDLRSNSVMAFSSAYGIIAPYIQPVWQAGTVQVGDSDLILEGGDF